MKDDYKPIGRKSDIVVQDAGEEIMVYDLKENRALCLNPTSAMIWQACNGNNSVDEIKESISKYLNLPVKEDLIWLALEELRKENLIENAEEIPYQFKGLSRRKVIRRVGFASLIALPIVYSIVAPAAVQAQSCSACDAPNNRAAGCSCGTPISPGTQSGDDALCCSGTCGGTAANRVCV